MTSLCRCLATLKIPLLKNGNAYYAVKMLSSKSEKENKKQKKRSNKHSDSEEEYVRVIPKESDYSQDEKDHYWLTFSTRINAFLEEFSVDKDSIKKGGNKVESAKNNVIETVPGFSYNDQTSIDNIRKKSAEKVSNKIKQVENEILDEDRLAEQQQINKIVTDMEYLQSISEKFITHDNLETNINRVLDNPICYCYALDMNGQKYHGYAQIEGQEMKSLWDGNPHPSSFESYVDTRKPSQ